MPEIQLTLTPVEADLVLDALEADLDDYLEDAKDARAENNAEDAAEFSEAADRIRALTARLRDLVPEETQTFDPD